MSTKKEGGPQSFAMVIADADQGRIDRILSNDLANIIGTATSKANLHDTEWKGSMTLTIKATAEPNGKVTLSFARVIKVAEEGLPKARMYYDPDLEILTSDPIRQLKIAGLDRDREKPETRSAAAPTTGNDKKN